MFEKWVGLGAVVAVVASACGGTVIIDAATGSSSTASGTSVGTGYGGNTTVTTGYGGYDVGGGSSVGTGHGGSIGTGYGGSIGVGPCGAWSASGPCSQVATGYPTGYPTGFATGTTATASSSSSSGGAIQCPATAPTLGGACEDANGTLCTYGSSVNPGCRDQWTCFNNRWQTEMSECTETPPSQCPSSEPSSTTTCATTGDVCTYQEMICYCGCIGGFCPDPPTWSCAPPPGDCPALAPNSGTPCPSEDYDTTCSYGVPCTSTSAIVSCTNSVWEWQGPEVCGL